MFTHNLTSSTVSDPTLYNDSKSTESVTAELAYIADTTMLLPVWTVNVGRRMFLYDAFTGDAYE